MASQSPVKFTIGRFGLAQQDRVVVPIRSAVYLGENIGLEVGVVSQQREACTRVVLRVEHAVEGVRPDVLFSNTAEPLDVLVRVREPTRARTVRRNLLALLMRAPLARLRRKQAPPSARS